MTQTLFKEAEERAKLLDTPPSQRTDPPPPYVPSPNSPAAQVTVQVKVTVTPSPSKREVRKLTVEDIVKERYKTDPQLMRQYQKYLNSFLIPSKQTYHWSFRNGNL